MADTKISDLTAVVTPALTDTTAVVQGGVTKKETLTQIRTVMVPIVLSADVSGTLPVANGGTGITSLGTGVATWCGTPSSANLASALTDETGTGACVFGTAPLFKTTINLNNPGDTFKYVVTPAAIVADRILNLPLLTGTDTVVSEAFAQTLTNKTIAGGSNTVTGLALTTAVTGTLPVANGGTGVTALTSFTAAITTTGKVIVGALAVAPRISNATTGNQDNIPVGVVIQLTDGINIRGISSTGVTDGQIIFLLAPALATGITILHQNANSTDVNRIITWNDLTINLYQNSFAALIYDGTATRWKFLKEGF